MSPSDECLFPQSFLALPDEVLQKIQTHAVARTYRAGQVLYYENNQPFGVFWIQNGLVKLTLNSSEGKQYIRKLCTGGQILGFSDALLERPFRDTAEIVKDARIAFIEWQDFQVALNHTGFLLNELKAQSQSLLDQQTQLQHLAYESVLFRLGHLLLNLAEEFGLPQDLTSPSGQIIKEIKVGLPLSREELAQMIGSTVESTVRMLKSLEEQGLIRKKNKSLIITRPEALKAYMQQGH